MKIRTTEIQKFSTTVTCRVETSFDGIGWSNCGLMMAEKDAWHALFLVIELGCREAGLEHIHESMVGVL